MHGRFISLVKLASECIHACLVLHKKTSMRTIYYLIATFFASSCGTNNLPQQNSTSSEPLSEDFDVVTTLIMANSYYEQDNYEQAAKGFELIIRLDSTIGEAHYKLGFSLAQLESDTMYLMTHPSIEHFIKAAQLDYRSAEAYQMAATYTSIFGQDDSTAIELFRKSIEIYPDQPSVLEAIEQAEQRLSAKYGIQQI
jgi:tetratricopeptide (TPR) repeat protein